MLILIVFICQLISHKVPHYGKEGSSHYPAKKTLGRREWGGSCLTSKLRHKDYNQKEVVRCYHKMIKDIACKTVASHMLSI